MADIPKIKFFGWSSFAIESKQGVLHFDPFFRHYCGAQWYSLDDYADASVICLTHGHEEHYLDTPAVVERSGATVVSSPEVCKHLNRKYGIAKDKLVPLEPFEDTTVSGFKISTFEWPHRDINVFMVVLRALMTGKTAQLKWAWSSLVNAPFSARKYGYHVEVPGGQSVLNYNEGFNSLLNVDEVRELGKRFSPDVVLAGAQLHFEDYVAAGTAALGPSSVILHHPHEKFFEQIGAESSPPDVFAAATRTALPDANVVAAEPGTELYIGPKEA